MRGYKCYYFPALGFQDCSPAFTSIYHRENAEYLAARGFHGIDCLLGRAAGRDYVFDHDDRGASAEVSLDQASGPVLFRLFAHAEPVEDEVASPARGRHSVGNRVGPHGEAAH